jgi:hypothetical protein
MEEPIMKTQHTNTRRRVGLVMAIILFFGVTAPAQQERQLAQAMQQNAKELRQYSWKSRTEVRKDTELKSFQLYLMHYAADGTLQQSLIDEMSPKIPTHGLRGLIAKKKKEDLVKTLEGLKAIAKSYGDLSPEKMKEFITNANINIEPNPQPGRIRIQGREVLQPGDSVTIWVDTLARRQRRMEINTTFDKEIVRIVTDFQDIPGGPTYMSRSVIDYQSEGISLVKENFDYHRNQFAPGVTAGVELKGMSQ